MPGLFRGLAKAAIEGYKNAKEQQLQAQRDAFAQARAQQENGYVAPTGQYQQQQHQYQQNQRQDPHQAYSPPSLPPRQQQQQQQQPQRYEEQPQHQQPEQAYSPPPPPAPPQEEKQPQVTTIAGQSSSPRPIASPSPGCKGLDTMQSSQICITALAPDLDICPSCHQVFILPSPFASNFTLISDPNARNKTCDMAVKGVRDAFKEACVRGSTGTDTTIWLQRFSQQAQTTMSRVTQLYASITALKEQIQVAALQAQFTQASAMNQIQHGFSMSCINSIGGGNYYDGGSVISANGNQRFAQATQMKMDVHMKEYELNRLVAEFRGLVGCDESGRATWT